MKPMTAYRLTALSCMWFAVFSMLPAMKVWMLAPVYTVAAILLASFVALQLKKPVARLGVSALPLLTLLYAWQSGVLTTVVCAVPIVAAAAAVTTDHAEIEYWRYRREFLAVGVVGIILLLLSLNPLLFSAQALAYFGGYLVFGILALRAGRVGAYRSARWQGGNTGLFVLTLAGAAGGGTLLMFGIDALIKWLKTFIVEDKRGYQYGGAGGQIVEANIALQEIGPASTSSGHQVYATLPPDTVKDVHIESSDPWWIAAIVLGVAAAAALVVLLLAREKGKKEQAELTEEFYEEQRKGARVRRGRRGRAPKTNNDRVREIYRNYLNHLRVNGVSIRDTATTSDVSQSAAALKEDDTTLRALYRKARYGRADDPITDEELRRAQQCYDELIEASREAKEKK